MKKLLILLLLTLFSFVLIGQERELSDYEKYRMEKDNERLGQQDEEVFYIVEDMPKFKGEDGKEFRKYIAENVRYPKEAVQNGTTGKVIVSFIVDKNGDVTNAKVEKSVDPYLDAEAIRVVESSPKWIAGKQRGVAVNVQFTFPINFVLDVPQEQAEPVVINNYYNDYNQPNYRFLLTFGYHYPYYSHYYDPFYYGYNYGYYGSYYPYWGYNSHYYGSYYYGHNHYYGYNYYNYGYYSRPRGQRYATSNALGWNRNYYQPYNKTYGSGYVPAPTSAKKNVVTTRTQSTRPTYSESKRSYTPTYQSPKMSTRPSYNNSTTRTRATTIAPSRSVQQRSTTVRTPASTQRSTYSRPSSTQNRSSSTYTRPSTSQTRSYRAPSTAPSRSSSSSYSRPSSSSSSRSYSSGSATRSSGSATRSSGGKK